MILALDLSTRVGWALGGPDMDVPLFGTHRLPSTGEKVGRFTIAFELWLDKMLAEHRPDEIVFEETILPATTSRATLLKLYGLQIKCEEAGEPENACMKGRHKSLRVREVSIPTWRKHFLGRGNAPKEIKGSSDRRKWIKRKAIETCHARGWMVEGDDEADACGILDYALATIYPDYAARSFTLKPGFSAMGAS